MTFTNETRKEITVESAGDAINVSITLREDPHRLLLDTIDMRARLMRDDTIDETELRALLVALNRVAAKAREAAS